MHSDLLIHFKIQNLKHVTNTHIKAHPLLHYEKPSGYETFTSDKHNLKHG